MAVHRNVDRSSVFDGRRLIDAYAPPPPSPPPPPFGRVFFDAFDERKKKKRQIKEKEDFPIRNR